MTEGKSLAQWRFEIRTVGKKHWGVFYADMLGHTLTSYPRFFRALNMYGDILMFEAIILASNQDITGDPLNYMLKIAHSNWLKQQADIESANDYEHEIQTAINHSVQQNKELAKKLQRLRRD